MLREIILRAWIESCYKKETTMALVVRRSFVYRITGVECVCRDNRIYNRLYYTQNNKNSRIYHVYICMWIDR